MEAAVATATGEGATVVAGGTRLADGELADGCFFAPTVLADVGAGHDDRPRGGVRPGHRLRAGRLARRGDRLGQRRRLRALGGDLHPLARRRPAVRRRDPGRHGAGQPADRRGRLQRPVRRRQAVGHGNAPRAARTHGDGLLHRQPHRVAGERRRDGSRTRRRAGARARVVVGARSGGGCRTRRRGRRPWPSSAATSSAPRTPAERSAAPRHSPATSPFPADAARLVAEAVAALGGLDICVVNTGGGKPGGILATTGVDDEAAYHSMLRPALDVARAAAPHLAAGGRGRLVFLTARSVVEATPDLALSSVMRSGVAAAASSLALELAPDVLVNVVVTGQFDTPALGRFEAAKATLDGTTARPRARRTHRRDPSRPARHGRRARRRRGVPLLGPGLVRHRHDDPRRRRRHSRLLTHSALVRRRSRRRCDPRRTGGRARRRRRRRRRRSPRARPTTSPSAG